ANPTRLSLSLVCLLTLSSVAVASTLTIPPNDANSLTITNDVSGNVDRHMWAGGGKNPYDYTDKAGWGSDGDWTTANTGRYPSIFDYTIFDYKYKSMPKINLLFRDNTTIKHLSVHYVKEGGGITPWEYMQVQGIKSGSGNRNLTIGTFDVKGDVKFEIKLGGKSTIDTLNNTAERLNIKVNNENGTDTLTISTLNQTTQNSDSQIFKNVTIDTFNLQNGKSYQRGGNVGTLNLQGGEFHLGAKDDLSQAEHNGVVDNLVLQNGTFKQYKGEINNITLTSDKETASFTANNSFKDQTKGTYDGLISKVDKNTNGENTVTFGNNGGTITTTLTTTLTIDNKKGDITNNGAVSSLDVSKKVGSAIVYNSNGASIEKLTSNDDSTIHNQGKITDLDFKGGSVNNHNGGEITKLDLKGGSLNNAGTITTLNNSNGTAINNEGTITTFTNTNKNTATI
ncbi:TPA: hypothetical protein R1X38_001762, partial [Campylobacter upsaliensis]|nr:hypothetical protein [Campylobacter upsaliensis]